MSNKITILTALLFTNLLAIAQASLQVTEIFPGNEPGTNLTADWFEITNTGTQAWVFGTDGDLFYDDDSQDPMAADIITGITNIQPNESAIVILGDTNDLAQFLMVWETAYDLSGIQIGLTDGSGLGQGGDGVTLFVGGPTTGDIVDFQTYPDANATGGQTYDILLAAFSTVGNANNAGATFIVNNEEQPAIGSPGNQGPIAPVVDLQITEIWSGNEPGNNLTSDWFEILNNGTAAWITGTDGDLFYDDDSQDPSNADIIAGITDIQPGERVIVVLGDATDATEFNTIWSPDYNLSDIQIGYSDGSGLGGSGDGVTLWIGDPNTTGTIADYEDYVDADANGGQSYDVELTAYSTVLNGNNAGATSTLNNENQPAIASPGNQGPLSIAIDIQITEIWAGQDGTDITGDWFELYNAGTSAWLSGTSPELWYDDVSASPNDATLIEGITDIQPGESVIVMIGIEADATTFEAAWSQNYDLTDIEIGYTDGAGLGGSDTVTLWLGNPTASGLLIDAEGYEDSGSYNAQSYDTVIEAYSTNGGGTAAPGTNVAGTSTLLGGDNSDTPAIASPGNQGPLSIVTGAPEITVDTANLSAYLRLSEQGPSSVSGVINDPTDPAATIGIPFNVSDDGVLVSFTVESSNTSVVDNTDVVLSPAFNATTTAYTLTITPSAVGFSTITLTLTDNDSNTDSYTINYAASEASLSPSTSRFHVGASDGSTAIPIDTDYMWVGDDEDQTIRLYDRNNSGLPLTEINFNDDLGSTTEIDIEGSFREGNTIYWIGSTATAPRSVMFSTSLSGAGVNSTLTYGDKYTSLRDDLLNGGFGLPTNFEIESLALAPNGTTAYLGFRVPNNSGYGLVIPVTNFTALPGAPAGSATFGTAINLDLGGRTLRSMECNADGCLLIAGPSNSVSDFALYTWSGNASDAPELRNLDLTAMATGGSFEGIVGLPSVPFLGNAGDELQVTLMSDLGATVIYNDGTENKDQRNEWKKHRTNIVTIGEVVIPTNTDPLINEFVANHLGVDNYEYIEILGDPNTDYSNYTILQIEGDNTSGQGTIDVMTFPVGTTDANGYFVTPYSVNTIENGTMTLLLVENFTGTLGDDIDTNDDGVIDNVPWTRIVDGIATFDGGADDLAYAVALMQNYDGNSEYHPGGASRIPNGVDTDTSSDWVRNDIDGAGIPALTPGTPDLGEALNTPGTANHLVTPELPTLQITEIWPGNEPGANLTADWFEITNTSSIAWTPALGGLYFDDDSQDPASAALISGITSIQPGEVVIAVDDDTNTEFLAVWEPAYNLTGIQVGTYAGSGLGGGGDAVTLWIGDPTLTGTLADYETYPDTNPNANGGQSYDVDLGAFSVVGNANFAAATILLNDVNQPAIGSPGNQGPALSINEYEHSNLEAKLFPIPFDNSLNLSLNLNTSVYATINIVNLLGKTVYSETRLLSNGITTLENLSNLASGVYILSISELDIHTRILKN